MASKGLHQAGVSFVLSMARGHTLAALFATSVRQWHLLPALQRGATLLWPDQT